MACRLPLGESSLRVVRRRPSRLSVRDPALTESAHDPAAPPQPRRDRRLPRPRRRPELLLPPRRRQPRRRPAARLPRRPPPRPPPPGFAAAPPRALLGVGDETFSAACACLRRWDMFDLGWVSLFWPH